MIRSVGRPPLEVLAWSSHNAPPVARFCVDFEVARSRYLTVVRREFTMNVPLAPGRGAVTKPGSVASGLWPPRMASGWRSPHSWATPCSPVAMQCVSGSATVSLRRCGVQACDSR
jgi:hypothetical protein